ncbi:hypothetical protein Bca52824_094912 [Brassica carinata]|uniref:Uncharacterized protein n=1 Tax=Brassica carinata TaxID=52824 RepID=A0A8X7P3H2_BRACI|nr:hypothetical protein Bca52824_094912 [Brassica carinata]
MEGSKTRKLVAGYHHGPWYSRTVRLLAGTTLHPPDRVCRKSGMGWRDCERTFPRSAHINADGVRLSFLRNWKSRLHEQSPDSAFRKNFEPVQDLALAATSPDYRAKKLNNTFFYYGGPEQIKSGGANLMLNHIFMLTTTSLRLFRRRRSTLPKTFIAKNGTVMLTFIPCTYLRPKRSD